MIRKIYNNFIKRFLPQSLVNRLKASDSVCFQIIQNPNDIFDSVCHIKDATWEKVNVPDAYHLYQKWTMEQYHAEQDILCINDCFIINSSDIVITSHGVVWDKYYYEIFSKTEPIDGGLFKYDKNNVFIRKPNYVKNISGHCISLMGVYAHVWPHFIVQFLPKLYYAEKAGILDKEVTILMPEYIDGQVLELVDAVFKKHPLAKKFIVQEVKERVYYRCECLYYLPTSSTLVNISKEATPFDIVIPRHVINVLNENMVNPLINKIKSNSTKHDKIYLVRRNKRSITNVNEVENYFKDKGFYFVEPHTLTLEEKVDLFYHAKVIVGPHSSAWTNICFCKNVKGLMFAPISRLIDLYFGYLNFDDANNIMMVTGDDCSSSTNTDYYIPLQKIDAAYNQLMNE